MAETLLKTRVNDPHAKEASTLARLDLGKPAARDDGNVVSLAKNWGFFEEPRMLTLHRLGPSTNRKTAANVQSPTAPSSQTLESQSPVHNGGEEGRGPSQAAPMDPLSQVRAGLGRQKSRRHR